MVKETTTSSSSSNTSSAYSGKTKSYTVQRGEGLIGLASRFNIPVTTLAAMNDMSPNEQLLVGQRLTVPADTASSSSSTSSSTSNSKSSSSSSSYSGETTRYTVKSGDTLIGIANKLGVAHTQIADINNFSATTQLQRGQTIKLPVAKEQVARNLNNQTIKYKVQSGDSLTALANKYDLSISDLAKANNLSVTSNLLVGQVITIPGSSGSASSSSSTSSNTSSSSSSSSKSSSSSTSSSKVNYTGTYKVKAGDGLINLAREYGVSTADLAAANDISTTAGLFVGQTLKVPSSKASGGSSSSTSSSASSSAPASKATSTSGNYTVKSGDSLIALAGQYGVSVSQLASANGLSNNAQLQIGQKITIPATITTYKVQSGDSLIGLAKKYGISPQKLAELNGISSTAMLQLGQTIKVPVQ